jgi:hypothetical protein
LTNNASLRVSIGVHVCLLCMRLAGCLLVDLCKSLSALSSANLLTVGQAISYEH